MVSEQDSLFKVLKDSTRRRIVLLLKEEQHLTYVELMARSRMSNTGRFNYHLKVLADFLGKDEDGRYCLTEKGWHVAQLLSNGSAWNSDGKNRANFRGIILIGILGFAATLLNPAILENFVGTPLTVGMWPSILSVLYGFLVPGAFMWLLCNKHLKNQEIPNTVKAPLFSVVLLMFFVLTFGLISWVALSVWGIRIGFPLLQEGASAPRIVIQNGHEVITQQMTYGTMPILTSPLAGIYSLAGFLLAEALQRLHESKKQENSPQARAL